MAKTLLETLNARFDELVSLFSAKPAAGAAAPDHTQAITDFRSQLAGFKSELTAKDGEITTLKAQAETDKTTISGLQTKIKDLEAKAKTAGETAADIVAGQGLKVEDMPAAGTPAGGAPTKPSLRAQYNKLIAEGKSTEAGAFYAEHAGKPEFWKQ